MSWTPTAPYQSKRPFNDRDYDRAVFDIGTQWDAANDDAVPSWSGQNAAIIIWETA